MRLIASTFGLDAADPYVPPIEFVGARDVEHLDRTVLEWSSVLPAAADESVNALPAAMRAEATLEHTEFAAGITRPWTLRVDTTSDEVTVTVAVSGPCGWHAEMTASGCESLGARALEIAVTAWAVWHASGFAVDHHQLIGVLWLTGAGHKWNDAAALTAALANA